MLEVVPPDPVLRFSHPLLREAAEAMLSGLARRRLHRVIGAAVEDPDEAAWHLARGADEPDEALAGRVERAAEHAAARGAAARAAALARSAADLTSDPDSPDSWRRRIYWLERLRCCGRTRPSSMGSRRALTARTMRHEIALPREVSLARWLTIMTAPAAAEPPVGHCPPACPVGAA